MCGLGPDLVGIHSIGLEVRYRAAACPTTLNQGLGKIQVYRGHNSAPIFALSPDWEKDFLAPSVSCSTADPSRIVCRLDHDGKLDQATQNKKQKVATNLLRGKLYEQDFTFLRPSKVVGPLSRYRVADILLPMKLASRASRPGLTVGVLRILCTGLCTAQKFALDETSKCVVLDVDTDPILSLTATGVLFCTIYFFLHWSSAST